MASSNRKILSILVDLVEIYIPCMSFSIMFLSFIVQIFTRYVLNSPLIWTYELTIFGFIWTALLGALYAKRRMSHVKFTLLYDAYSPQTQVWIRLAGNGLILVAFIAGFWPALDYVLFMGFKKSTVLKIPYDVAFFPFVVFMVGMIIRFAIDVWNDLKILNQKTWKIS